MVFKILSVLPLFVIFKNLLEVLSLSEEWSDGEKVDELNSAEETEAHTKPNTAAKLG